MPCTSITSIVVGSTKFELRAKPYRVGAYWDYKYEARRNNGEWIDVSGCPAIPSEWLEEAEKPIGYHVRDIPRGTVGEASKILEEAAEFGDAIEQGVKVMALIELSDMIGATQAYLDNHFPGTTIDDLCHMAAVTKRAFTSGQREVRA